MSTPPPAGRPGDAAQRQRRSIQDRPGLPELHAAANRLCCRADRLGIDKFFNVVVNWENCLALDPSPEPTQRHPPVHIVGVIEIAAGVAAALKPRYGAYLVAAWLAGIIVNLLSYSATTTSRYATSD